MICTKLGSGPPLTIANGKIDSVAAAAPAPGAPDPSFVQIMLAKPSRRSSRLSSSQPKKPVHALHTSGHNSSQMVKAGANSTGHKIAKRRRRVKRARVEPATFGAEVKYICDEGHTTDSKAEG